MTVRKDALNRLTHQDRGLLPEPSLILLVYLFLCYPIHITGIGSLTAPDFFDFWSMPHYIGLSLLDLFTAVNILFAAYLLASAWSLASEKGHRILRSLSLWIPYIFSIVLVVLLQVYVQKIRNLLELPEEILALRSQYHDVTGGQLEDVILPRSDLCKGITRFDDRLFITISRSGDLILNRRNLGAMDRNQDRIRSILLSEAGKRGKDHDGRSNMILLIRGDYQAEFEHIHKVMEICKEDDIKIHRIEWHCNCDLARMAPEAMKKLNHFYRIPAGKFDIELPVGAADREEPEKRIAVDVFRDKSTPLGFRLAVETQPPDQGRTPDVLSLKELYLMMKSHHERWPDVRVILRTHPGVEYNHVVKTYTECLRGEVKDVRFESVTGEE